MSYFTNTNIILRISLNPFQWNWIPFASYDNPTQIFPKRKTFGIGWLFVQLFFDIDNGEMNLENFVPVFAPEDVEVVEIDEDDVREMGSKVSKPSKASVNLE